MVVPRRRRRRLAVRLGARFALMADLHVVPTWPRQRIHIIHIGDVAVGTIGAPSYLFGAHALLLL